MTDDSLLSYAGIASAVRRVTREVLRPRPRITADRDIHRWIVRYRGHIYPFATWRRAMDAASDPDHLCRHTCICPVLDRAGRAS